MKLLLVFLAAAVATMARAQDDDEFGAPVAAAPAAVGVAPVEEAVEAVPSFAPPKPIGGSVKAKSLYDYPAEVASIAFLVFYIAYFVYGRSVNGRILRSVHAAVKPALEANFSQPGALERVNEREADVWSTGRRNVKGQLTQVQLKPRQDLLSSLFPAMGSLLGLPSPSEPEAVSFEVALEGAQGPAAEVEAFTVLALRGPDADRFKSEDADAVGAGKRAKLPQVEPRSMPVGTAVFSEAREVAEAVLGSDEFRAAKAAPGAGVLLSCVLTAGKDAPFGAGLRTSPLGRVLRVQVALPEGLEAMGAGDAQDAVSRAVGPWLSAVLSLADGLSRSFLPSAAKRALKDAQDRLARIAAEREREERLAKQREEDEAAEAARIKRMSPRELAAWQAENQRKEAEKQSKKLRKAVQKGHISEHQIAKMQQQAMSGKLGGM